MTAPPRAPSAETSAAKTLWIVVIAVAVRGLVSVFGYALLVLVSRALSTAEYGRYAFAASVALAGAALGVRGTDQLLVQQAPRLVVGRSKFLADLQHFVQRRTTVGVAIAVPLGMALVAVQSRDVGPADYLLPALLVGALIATGAYATVENAWLSAHQRPLLADAITLLGTAVLTLVAFAGVRYGFGRESGTAALLAQVVGTVGGLVAVYYVNTALRAPVASNGAGPLQVRHWTRVGKSFLQMAVCQAASGRSIVIALGLALDAEEFALVFAAWKISQLLEVPQMAVGSWAAPRFAGDPDHERLQSLLTLLARFLAGIGLTAGLALLVVREPVLGFFGSDFAEASTALMIMVIGRVVVLQFGPVPYLLGAMGSHRVMLRIEVVLAVVGLPAATAAAWGFGVTGAAVGIALTSVVRTVAMWWALGRHHSLWGLPISPNSRGHALLLTKPDAL